MYGVFVLLENPQVSSDPSLWYYVHVFWLPLMAEAFGIAVGVLGGLGYLLIRQRLPTLQSSREVKKLRLGGLAFLAAVAAFVVFTFTGVVMALIYAPALARVHTLLYILFTIGVGFFLYWTLGGIGPRVAGFAGTAALVLGITGTILINRPRVVPSETASSGLDVLGAALAYASLAIWLAAYLWSYAKLRGPRVSYRTAALAG